MGKHQDAWARELIAQLVLTGRRISVYMPMEVEAESKVHRGSVDVAWFVNDVFKGNRVYFCVFEIETSKSDWPRIRSNSAKLVSLNPAIVCHIFKPGIRIKSSEREELIRIHSERNCYIINTQRQIAEMLKDLGRLFSRKNDVGRFVKIKLPSTFLRRFDEAVRPWKFQSIDEAVTVVATTAIEHLSGVPTEKYSPCSSCGSHRIYFSGADRKAICLECGLIRSYRRKRKLIDGFLEETRKAGFSKNSH